MSKLPLSHFFLKNAIFFFWKSFLPPFSKSFASHFRAALSLVRGGSSVERSGEGEGSGVELCGGRWRQTRYADGGLFVADVRMSSGST